MDSIGNITDFVVTGSRQSRGGEFHSHPVSSSGDRVDIQRGHWASFNLRQPWSTSLSRTNPMSDEVVA